MCLMDTPMIQTEKTYVATLYLAGPIEVAKQTLRELAVPGGLCVTITPTTFIYRGGEETGYSVGFVNYPRFPETAEQIRNKDLVILDTLLDRTYQSSGLLVTPDSTEWISKREL